MKTRVRFECPHCWKTHEYQRDAMECCLPEEVYECAECGKIFPFEKAAEECFDAHNETEPSPQELEAAGQSRLIP